MQYHVIVTRDVTESVLITVEADSPDAADVAALKCANDLMANLNWEPDEGNFSEPYIGAPGEAEADDA